MSYLISCADVGAESKNATDEPVEEAVCDDIAIGTHLVPSHALAH